MGSWRDKYKRRRRDIPPAPPGTAVAVDSRNADGRGPRLRFFRTKLNDNDTVFSIPDGSHTQIETHESEMLRNKKILDVRGRDSEKDKS